eukprot:GHUV01023117.1.p2 GENE.GHUV01023117.1~~GHUV01023117.1.p2  ORF type:complete len:110 (+),score=2.90 GHUV01023117.1:316-645(+)
MSGRWAATHGQWNTVLLYQVRDQAVCTPLVVVRVLVEAPVVYGLQVAPSDSNPQTNDASNVNKQYAVVVQLPVAAYAPLLHPCACLMAIDHFFNHGHVEYAVFCLLLMA